jgi:hypothetical protein
VSPGELEKLVIDLARRGDLSNERVREALGLTREETLGVLRRLVEGGRLTRIGERRATRYRLPLDEQGGAPAG